MNLFSDPLRAHFDSWSAALAVTFVAALTFTVAQRINSRRLWNHHPYRQEIGRHVTTAALASSLLLAIAVVSHSLGWPVYGKPVLGAIALTLFILTIAIWRTVYLSSLRSFESRWPETKEPHAKMPRANFRHSELPMFTAVIGAAIGYVGFIWHPWNHIFHEGMWLLGALVGVAGGHLYLVVMADTARLERAFRNHPGSRRKTGRRSN